MNFGLLSLFRLIDLESFGLALGVKLTQWVTIVLVFMSGWFYC